MRYSYRIKKRFHHDRCTRFYVQIRFLGVFWLQPEWLGSEINAAESLKEALKIIYSYERYILDGSHHSFECRIYEKFSEIIK